MNHKEWGRSQWTNLEKAWGYILIEGKKQSGNDYMYLALQWKKQEKIRMYLLICAKEKKDKSEMKRFVTYW